MNSSVPAALAASTIDPGAPVCIGIGVGLPRRGVWFTVTGTGGLMTPSITGSDMPRIFVYDGSCSDLSLKDCVSYYDVR